MGANLEALAARASGAPFYVAVPSPTFDWTISDGLAEIPIEERSAEEGAHVVGRLDDGRVARVAVTPPGAEAINPAFDATPAELFDSFLTDRCVAAAEAAALARFRRRAYLGLASCAALAASTACCSVSTWLCKSARRRVASSICRSRSAYFA
jgi:hypothetical protein